LTRETIGLDLIHSFLSDLDLRDSFFTGLDLRDSFFTGEGIGLDLIHSMDISRILNPTSGSSSSGTNLGSNPSGSNFPGGAQSTDEFNSLKKGLLDKLQGQYNYNGSSMSRQFSLYSERFPSQFKIKIDTAEAKLLHKCVLNFFDDGRYILKTVNGTDIMVRSTNQRTIPVNQGIINAVRLTKDL